MKKKFRKRTTGKTMHPALFIAFGALFLVMGFYWQKQGTRFAAGATEARGVVVDHVEKVETARDPSRGSTAKTLFYPVIEYTPEVGTAIRFQGNRGDTARDAVPVGSKVEVLYDPAKPADAGMKHRRRLNDFIVFIAGALFILAGAVGLYRKSRGGDAA